MDWMWTTTSETVTIRDVSDAFSDYAYTTLATIMDRLVAKGVLRSELDGRTKRFAATGNRESHTAVLMYDALSGDDDPAPALRRFAASLSRSEAAILRSALDEPRRSSRRSGGRTS